MPQIKIPNRYSRSHNRISAHGDTEREAGTLMLVYLKEGLRAPHDDAVVTRCAKAVNFGGGAVAVTSEKSGCTIARLFPLARQTRRGKPLVPLTEGRYGVDGAAAIDRHGRVSS